MVRKTSNSQYLKILYRSLSSIYISQKKCYHTQVGQALVQNILDVTKKYIYLKDVQINPDQVKKEARWSKHEGSVVTQTHTSIFI